MNLAGSSAPLPGSRWKLQPCGTLCGYRMESPWRALSFAQAHFLQSNNWAKASLQLLEKWSVLDWPVWASCRRAHPTYQLYVRETMQYSSTLAWKAAVAKHTLPLCYLALCDAPSSQLRAAFKLNVAWASLLGHRDLLLLRCGFIRLGHIDHRPSRAAILRCIFCDRRYSSIHSHVVCRCSHFETCSRPCMPCDSLSILNVQPGAPLFEQVSLPAVSAPKLASSGPSRLQLRVVGSLGKAHVLTE